MPKGRGILGERSMTEKVKKYMLSEAGVLELEAYVKKKIGEELDELFLNRGDPNGK